MYKSKLPEILIKYKSGDLHRSKIKNSKDAEQVFKKMFDTDLIEWREEFIMLCMNRANNTISYYKVSTGGMTGVVVDPKIVFSVALTAGASGLMFAHNHPSGNLDPSRADLEITKRLVEGGKILGIDILDHLIITTEGYYSFRDEGLI